MMHMISRKEIHTQTHKQRYRHRRTHLDTHGTQTDTTRTHTNRTQRGRHIHAHTQAQAHTHTKRKTHTRRHTLDKNGSLIDPMGTESPSGSWLSPLPCWRNEIKTLEIQIELMIDANTVRRLTETEVNSSTYQEQVRDRGVPQSYPDEWLELRWIRPGQTSLIPLLDSTNYPLILHATSSLHTHMAPHSEGQNSKAHEPFYDTTASFF